MNVSMDDDLKKLVEKEAALPGYTSTSEVVREALRTFFGLKKGSYQLSETEEQAVLEGLASGESSPLNMGKIIEKGNERLRS